MAFVYTAEPRLTDAKNPTPQDIGPGYYIQHQPYQIQKLKIPFNSTEKREAKKIKEENITPSPGHTQHIQTNINEKVFITSYQEEMKVMTIPKPSFNFKSKSKRFQQTAVHLTQFPGPGTYEQNIQPLQRAKGANNYHQLEVVTNLLKLNKHQSTPSIPSKFHGYGYTEKENAQLQLNNLPPCVFSGIKNDCIGPGQYNLKDVVEINKQKGTVWHMYSGTRSQSVNQKINNAQIGPGSYEVQKKPVIQCKNKEMNGFASKSLRTLETRKGAISNQFFKSKITQKSIQSNSNTTSNQQMETSLGDGDADIDLEDDFEYIEDCTPGPGYYYDDKKMSSFKFQKPKNRKFTQGRNRFFINKIDQNPIGPGQYNPQLPGLIGQNPYSIKCRSPPFLSSNTRFEIKKQENKFPGPGTYDTHTNLEDKLIEKLQKGYRGSFCTTEKRFKNQNDVDEFPGPGAYIEIIKEETEQEAKSPSAVFKSSLDRCLYAQSKDQKPPVGTYELNYFNIQNRINNVQEDPYIKITVANLGFNTSEPRFKDLEKKKQKNINGEGNEEEDDQDEDFLDIEQLQKNFNKGSQQQQAPFLSKANRFDYKVKENYPSPGTYHDPQALANKWNKRTYNINFADF